MTSFTLISNFYNNCPLILLPLESSPNSSRVSAFLSRLKKYERTGLESFSTIGKWLNRRICASVSWSGSPSFQLAYNLFSTMGEWSNRKPAQIYGGRGPHRSNWPTTFSPRWGNGGGGGSRTPVQESLSHGFYERVSRFIISQAVRPADGLAVASPGKSRPCAVGTPALGLSC